MEDNLIIELYWKRSESAIAETATKFGRFCTSISFNILANREDSDECVNDAYLKIWNSIPTDKPNSLIAYIGKIVRNLSLNKYRNKRTQKRGGGKIEILLSELDECVPLIYNVEEECDETQLSDKISLFLKSLTEESMLVFVRRYWFVDSITDISKRYNMSQSKVKSMLMRTRNKLKSFLEMESDII